MNRIICMAVSTALCVGTSAALAQGESAQAPSGPEGGFNPQMSVILDGTYYRDGEHGVGDELLNRTAGSAAGHGHEDEHGHGAQEGFNLRETEIALSAAVDYYFDALAYVSIAEDGGVELEEAYFQTRNLPAGFKLKGGKFLSDFGYINRQHPHQWDFVDQNLAYRSLIGEHGLVDTGLQLTWLPEWPVYTLFGLELLQGRQEKFGATLDAEEEGEALANAGEISDADAFAAAVGVRDPGPRLFTGFVKLAPDLGYDHALQFGLSVAYASQQQEVHEADAELQALTGDAWLLGTDWVYKYDAGQAYGKGDWTVQAEYLYAHRDMRVAYNEATPAEVGAERRAHQDGFYAQATYGFAPRWSAGLRYDAAGWTNELEGEAATLERWDSSDRWTAAFSFKPTEFSRLRLQVARADLALEEGREAFNQVYLQYQHSLGAHGAHTF